MRRDTRTLRRGEGRTEEEGKRGNPVSHRGWGGGGSGEGRRGRSTGALGRAEKRIGSPGQGGTDQGGNGAVGQRGSGGAAVLPSAYQRSRAAEMEAADFRRWMHRLKRDASSQGVSRSTLEASLGGLTPWSPWSTQDRNKPETRLSAEQYVSRYAPGTPTVRLTYACGYRLVCPSLGRRLSDGPPEEPCAAPTFPLFFFFFFLLLCCCCSCRRSDPPEGCGGAERMRSTRGSLPGWRRSTVCRQLSWWRCGGREQLWEAHGGVGRCAGHPDPGIPQHRGTPSYAVLYC